MHLSAQPLYLPSYLIMTPHAQTFDLLHLSFLPLLLFNQGWCTVAQPSIIIIDVSKGFGPAGYLAHRWKELLPFGHDSSSRDDTNEDRDAKWWEDFISVGDHEHRSI